MLALDLLGHGHSPWEPPWDVDAHLHAILARQSPTGRRSGSGTASAGVSLPSSPPASRSGSSASSCSTPRCSVLPHVALDLAELERSDVSYATVEEAVQVRYDNGRVLLSPHGLVIESDRGHMEPGPDGRLRYRYCKSAVIAAWSVMASAPPRAGAGADAVGAGRRLVAHGPGETRRSTKPRWAISSRW